MSKISVIMPVYNVEKYLERGIKSILNQTFNDFELILIDDGSTDNSSIICDMYCKQDKRVNVIHKLNEGVSSARNLGIKCANGEFIMFIDPDDTLDNDAIEYLYKLIIEYEADVSCYKMKTYKNDILQTYINKNEKIKVYCGNEIIEKYTENGVFLYSSCNKLYRKELFIKNKFNENIRYAEDALFNLSVFTECRKVVMSNLQKYNYFINSGSTVTKINKNRIDVLRAQAAMFDILKNKYNKYTENITRDFINSSISIVVDIAQQQNLDKSLLLNLKQTIIENYYLIEKTNKVRFKQLFIFNIVKLNPNIILFLYRLRFKVERLRRGKL